MSFANDALISNQFLGGKLDVWQPKKGYRAGADPVFLAAAVPATSGQSVLELGCGAGVASLCLGRRVAGLVQFGVEVQEDYAELARRNSAENGIKLHVETCDLRELPALVRDQVFDQVFANPPYFKRSHGTDAADSGRKKALAGDTPLTDWVEIATRRLKPGGYMTMIQKADRLPDVFRAFDHRLGGVVVRPLAPRSGKEVDIVIIQAQKGARGPMRLLAPFILHEGDNHQGDRDSYTVAARQILRGGAALEIC
ncbi:MAG: methyltransferase domain-containing protein [Paracoccaceae bacterium]